MLRQRIIGNGFLVVVCTCKHCEPLVFYLLDVAIRCQSDMKSIEACMLTFVGYNGIIIIYQIGNATVVAGRNGLYCMLRKQCRMQRVVEFGRVDRA